MINKELGYQVRLGKTYSNTAVFTAGSYKVHVGDRQMAFSSLPFAAREVGNLAAIVPQTKRLLDNVFSPKVAVPHSRSNNVTAANNSFNHPYD